MRRILHQPLAALLTAGEPPVVFEEQVCADYLDEVQKALKTRPASLFRVKRVPEAESAVLRVAVLRGDPGLGMHAREILRLLTIGRVGRVAVEADADINRLRLAYDVEPGEYVRQ
ncbi:hypothetical protein LIX60_21680 [Streptomyces sp. S07_1.15]|uniref:hypothetical protein n=1 Tax=Streptomyces sp. S07_1.15 TaxID=2873925 RepID=UPI001D15822F|nr:hypothetical protein [Streptomyces sp. S07_1.15]MCC3654027.1 hypothetical protein [Streptomyces sp. S07_1.15]